MKRGFVHGGKYKAVWPRHEGQTRFRGTNNRKVGDTKSGEKDGSTGYPNQQSLQQKKDLQLTIEN